ncbi:microcin ABC transporter ATP-binding protein [Taibaiella sp. KBW10]|uniref:ABC transporter ATP-binding protein n=1 Tax=Taibaiella sp. KBW10 TaxID=2153357 RepID=UPI000F5B531E|nr:ABC transporter ATP-binding protein [Taibaiella sp. KBW10]RQO30230.1 microcin ABC transporter ATP-binding protein [Taibaiella sp. KBW10]
MLTVKNLHIRFEGAHPFHALQGISFRIPKGKTLALIGTSGSGKSLTSLAIMGLLPKNTQQTGYIILEEKEDLILNKLSEQEWTKVRGKKVGMVFQEPMSALNPIMTVGAQLQESILSHQNISKAIARKSAISWLEKVKLPQPEVLYKRYPHQLSGGQKQRVMIAMAMCNHPEVLIADEPTTALDVTVQQEVIQLMKSLQQEFGTAMLFITHDLALAKLIADDYLILEKGKVVPKMHTPEFHRTEIPITNTEVILTVNQLKVYYPEQKNWLGKSTGYFKAVDGVSFQINKGETLGLVGESGCGKSTLSKCILGLQAATDGQISFKNRDITHLSTKEWQGLRRNIQIIFQDPYASLNPRIKIGDAIGEPILVHGLAKGKAIKNRVLELLDQVQLPATAINKYPHEFSGGQRQRICIARALAVQPELVICDESVSALDINIQAQILELLHQLQITFGLTYLFITHDLHVVKAISDRIMVMEKGRIVEQGYTHDILNHPQEAYTKKLLAAAPRL